MVVEEKKKLIDLRIKYDNLQLWNNHIFFIFFHQPKKFDFSFGKYSFFNNREIQII